MDIKDTILLKQLHNNIKIFEQKCKKTIKSSIYFWRLGEVNAVFEIGKGIRPALHFFFSKVLNNIKDINYTYAMLTEMLHFATLAHDDVLDEALLRRLNGTFKATYGNVKAILIGDLILATCYTIASDLKNPAFLKLLSETSYSVCKGEIMQHNEKFNFNIMEKQYLDIIYNKTAVLFGFSCCLANIGGRFHQNLYDIGTKIGVLYQIIDDFLDIYSSHKIIGKSTGKDLSRGTITLPLIYLFQIAQQNEINTIKKGILSSKNNILHYIRKLLQKYRIKTKIKRYINNIYKDIITHSEKILNKNDLYVLSQFLNTIIKYIK